MTTDIITTDPIDNVFLVETQKSDSQTEDIKYHYNNIFYHMLCISDSQNRFDRTYNKILKSGLIDHIDNIYVNCVGTYKNSFARNIQNKYKYKILCTIGEYDKDESETINMLRSFATNHPQGRSLYLHSKGCWRNYVRRRIRGFRRQAVQDWIDCMEYFLIEEFATCFNFLNYHDNCGVLFGYKNRNNSGYRGNFWWTNNTYVSSLKPCTSYHRHDSEWRFLSPHLSKYKNIYSYDGSLYKTLHPRSLYTSKSPLV